MTDLDKVMLALYRIRDAAEPPRDPIELVEALIAELLTFNRTTYGEELRKSPAGCGDFS